jgi:FdhD protein
MGDGKDVGHRPVVQREVRRWPRLSTEEDAVAVEEPLEIRVEGRPIAVVMRTPGADLDLVAGFLFTEGVIDGPDDLAALAHVDKPGDQRGNTVDVLLAAGVDREPLARATRALYATSSCGLCGKASIDRLLVAGRPRAGRWEPDPAVLRSLPEQLHRLQPGFSATGGLHGAALATAEGELELAREDVGRHNAVDKVLGARLRADRVPVDDRILVASSRAGFEIVQKAVVAGIPCIAAFGAATSLAIDLARDANVVLVAFLHADRYNVY